MKNYLPGGPFLSGPFAKIEEKKKYLLNVKLIKNVFNIPGGL